MNLFESEYLTVALLAGFIVTLFVSAITVTFDEYFKVDYRTKLLVLIASVIAASVTINFELAQWQLFVTKIIVTISFSVLFYHYLGGKFIRMLFLKIKKMLPGYGETDNDN